MRRRRALPAATLAALLLVGLTPVVASAAPVRADTAGADETDRVRDVVRDGRVVDIVRRVTSVSGDVRTSETPSQVEVALASDVLFAFDSAALSAEAGVRLQEVATRVGAESTGPVTVVGHTDSVGDDAYNQALSEQRAAAVVLALQGLAPADYQASGRGETEPAAPNTLEDGSDNPAGRQLNRRVTITFATAP